MWEFVFKIVAPLLCSACCRLLLPLLLHVLFVRRDNLRHKQRLYFGNIRRPLNVLHRLRAVLFHKAEGQSRAKAARYLPGASSRMQSR